MSLYSAADLPHEPTSEPSWQESVVLIFLDKESGVTGFIRAGSEPNLRLSQLHFSLATADGLRFRDHRFDLPMNIGDRTSNGFSVGPVTWRIPNGEYVHVTASTAEVDVDLKMYDYFESAPWSFPGRGLDDVAHGHVESSGRLVGSIRIGDRSFSISNGLAHRDHSWGKRDVTGMRNMRWVAGTCGEQLSFSGVTVQVATGHFMRAGWICRSGKLQHAKHFEVLSHVNEDGVTVRGGKAVWTLEEQEKVEIEATVVDGFLTSYRSGQGGEGSHIGVEGMATVRSGELEGFCDFNIVNNPVGGDKPVMAVCEAYATLKSGISHRPKR